MCVRTNLFIILSLVWLKFWNISDGLFTLVYSRFVYTFNSVLQFIWSLNTVRKSRTCWTNDRFNWKSIQRVRFENPESQKIKKCGCAEFSNRHFKSSFKHYCVFAHFQIKFYSQVIHKKTYGKNFSIWFWKLAVSGYWIDVQLI
jgi:hypothetical protein